MVKWIIGSEFVGLFFIHIGFFMLARCKRRSGKLVVGQCQLGIALHGVGPNRNSFVPSTELPK